MAQQPHTPIPQSQQPYYPPGGQYGQYNPHQQYNPPVNQYNTPTDYYNQAANKPYHDQYAQTATGPVELSASEQGPVEAPANTVDPTKVRQI